MGGGAAKELVTDNKENDEDEQTKFFHKRLLSVRGCYVRGLLQAALPNRLSGNGWNAQAYAANEQSFLGTFLVIFTKYSLDSANNWQDCQYFL